LNLLLIIAGVCLILAAGFILKGRKKKADRNARYRAPRTALKLDRASASGGRSRDRAPLLAKARPPASPAATIMLGLVLVVLSLWLAAAYLRPSAESAEAGNSAVRAVSMPPPRQVGALAGRLDDAPEPQEADQTPAASATPAPPLIDGALAAAQGDSNALGQVGLMPTSGPATSPAPTAPASRPSPPSTSPPTASPPAASATPAPVAPASTAPTPADSNLVRTLAGPPGATNANAPATAGRSPILSDTEGFTVHLASFVDQANAEKFWDKLTTAGEPAAISEILMDGRRWFRVMSGRFTTRTEADAHGRELRRRGLINDTGPFIVKPINSDN